MLMAPWGLSHVMTGRIIRAGMAGQSEDQTQGADQDTAARKRLPACGAKNRRGEPCRVTIVPGKRRCRFHGGLSTGPKTIEGKARIAAAQRRRWARRRGEDIRTERLRAISPIRIGPDDICALGAEDPEVRAASARLDRATPSTYRDLVAARLAAQACFGVPEKKRVPLYSGEVEDFLVPIMFRMGRGDGWFARDIIGSKGSSRPYFIGISDARELYAGRMGSGCGAFARFNGKSTPQARDNHAADPR
jgi:hypothetical protein